MSRTVSSAVRIGIVGCLAVFVSLSTSSVVAGQMPAAGLQALGPNDDVGLLADASSASRNFFIENVGQLPNRDVQYYYSSRGPLGTTAVGFAESSVLFMLTEDKSINSDSRPFNPAKETLRAQREGLEQTEGLNGVLVRVTFGDSGSVPPMGQEALPYPSNFLLGNDPQLWRTGIRSYREVVYPSIYDGIDLGYKATDEGLKSEFLVHPGADLSGIALVYEGVEKLMLEESGDLALQTNVGEINEAAPIAYQGASDRVPCTFRLIGTFSVGFDCSAWDHGLPLVIDPLLYGAFLGGSGFDEVYGVTTDDSHAAYLTGWTKSMNDFPITPGAFKQGPIDPLDMYDAFVTKVSPDGSTLVYSTFLGGGVMDSTTSIVVDSLHCAYVTGFTGSLDFPTTPGAYQTAKSGYGDAFVTKLNVDGSALAYSTYLGGNQGENGWSIDIDAARNAYVSGYTESTDFPVFNGAQMFFGGVEDAFVTKLNPTGTALVYSTYVGGSSVDEGYAINVDSAGYAYITGLTTSNDFPTPRGYDTTYNGGYYGDAYVTKLSSDGSLFLYSTFLGGSADDVGFGITVDGSGNAYATGWTDSTDYPVTPGAFDTTLDMQEGFVTKLGSQGVNLIYSTFLGGTFYDCARAISIDAAHNAYVTGYTISIDFPVTPGAFDTTCGTDGICNWVAWDGHDRYYYDGFLSELDSEGSALVYSTYLGGARDDFSYSVALDCDGCTYVGGGTESADFPVTAGSFDTSCGTDGNCNFDGSIYYSDGFIAKLGLEPSGPGQLFVEESVEWGSSILGATTNSVYAADVDGDGETEILTVGSVTTPGFPPPNVEIGVLRIWHWKCSHLTLEDAELFAVAQYDVRFNAVMAGDVDNDNQVEIVTAGFVQSHLIAGPQFQVLIWRWNGVNIVVEAEFRGPIWSIAYGLDIKDTEGDGVPEIFIAGSVVVFPTGMSGFLEIYEWNSGQYQNQAGTTWRTLSTDTEGRGVSGGHLGPSFRHIAVGGFNTFGGFRRAEVSVWAWDAVNMILSSRQNIWWGEDGGDTAINSVYNVDSDGDGYGDIHTAGYAWDSSFLRTNTEVTIVDWPPLVKMAYWQYPGGTYSEAYSVFAADIDDDSSVEIVVAGYRIMPPGVSYGELSILRWDLTIVEEKLESWSTYGNTAAHGVFAMDVEPDDDVEILTAGVAADNLISGVFGQLRIWNWNT